MHGSLNACTSTEIKQNVSEQTHPTEVLPASNFEVSTVQSDEEKIEIKMPVGLFVTNSAMDVGFATSTYASSQIDGVYLRLSWKAIEPRDNQHDWALLDREIQQAVDNNKKIVIGIASGKFTPDWVFNSGVKKLQFTEINHRGKGKKAVTVAVAPPWDVKYQTFILDLMTSLRDHLKNKKGFYDAVAMIKFTGMNISTNELRLPSQDKVTNGKEVTTDAIAIWQSADYTPGKVLTAFDKLMKGTCYIFKDKPISVPIIPDPQSFPAIDENGNECDESQQNVTQQVINHIAKKYKHQAFVQWNALRTGGRITKFISDAHESGIAIGFQLAENEFRINDNGNNEKMRNLTQTALDQNAYYLETWETTLTSCSDANTAARLSLKNAAVKKN